MKRLYLILALSLLAGCTSHTEFGPCVGAFDEKDPHLVYKISGWNLGMGLIFFEMIIPPILVITDVTFCPIGKRP